MSKLIMVFDQGTTSSRAVLFNRAGEIVAIAQKELNLIYPQSGWVEQDPSEIWATQMGVAGEVIQRGGVKPDDILGIGIANQRETTLLWDRNTGKPVMNAISWQCRRSAQICEELKALGWEDFIKEKTGLLPDAYFSATKIAWAFRQYPNLKRKAVKGDICFGTVDSWLIWNLTKGKKHITDETNASRSMLYNIHTRQWDKDLLHLFDLPENILPEVVPSVGVIGKTDAGFFGGQALPIAGVAGDQQAALFGQVCFEQGEAKNTYGTGCFMLMNTGENPVNSNKGLLSTVAWSDETSVNYALEGSIFNAGTVVQWMRDELKMISNAAESELLAQSVNDTNGVYFVPAFTGLGAPQWDMYARGMIIGLTRDTKPAHIIRAGLEAIAYQTKDVLELMEEEAGIRLKSLRTDGGASSNDFLMQFQADVLNRKVMRSAVQETTALGAAYMAGIALGYWKNKEEIKKLWKYDKEFNSNLKEKERDKLVRGWNKAVKRSLKWELEE